MSQEPTKLPGSKDENNKEIMELIDEARETGKVLRIEADGFLGGRQNTYVTKIYDLGEEKQDQDERFIMLKEQGFDPKFLSEQVLHNVMLKQYEAEILDISEVPTNEDNQDVNFQEKMSEWQGKENPLDSVYVFIKHTDDGRYKDDWKLYRGNSQAEIREEEGLSRPEYGEEKYVYYCLGNIRRVMNNTKQIKEEHDFDMKKGGGRGIPIDLVALTENTEFDLKELVEGVTNKYEG